MKKAKSPKISFVYFDVGGVILRWRGLLEQLAKDMKKPLPEVEAVFKKHDLLACQGKITVTELTKHVYDELQVPYTTVNFFGLLKETFTPITETHKLIKDVMKKYPVGLLTNIHHGTHHVSKQQGFIPDLPFTTIIQSCEIGLVKPDKEIFLHAQKAAKIKNPQEILFIDDYVENTEAAELLGWNTILFETDHPRKSTKAIRSRLKV